MASTATPKLVLLALTVASVVTAGVAGPVAASAGSAASSAAPAGAASQDASNPLVAAQEDCSFPVEYEDASGTTVTIDEEPDRIVTTAPSAAQTLYEIGAWDRVVGVSQSANFLDGFEDREVVSAEGRVGVDVETVVSLEPDLVVAPDVTPEEDVEQLRESGLTVIYFEEADSVEGVMEQTRQMGAFVGECEGAEETVEWMEDELATVREAVDDEEPVRALYVYAPEWGPNTAGSGTFIADALERAGATNVASEAGIEGHQTINDEVVASQDPEWLVVNSFDGQPPRNDVYNGTTAVEEDNVVVVDVNNFNQNAPRIVLAIHEMAKAFHPEAYEAANATPTPSPTDVHTPTPTSTPTATTDSTDQTTPSPTSTTGPGFGTMAALAALLAALALVRRR